MHPIKTAIINSEKIVPYATYGAVTKKNTF